MRGEARTGNRTITLPVEVPNLHRTSIVGTPVFGSSRAGNLDWMPEEVDPLARAPLSIVPPEQAGAPETPDAIFLAGGSRDWSLWAACDTCGGYALPLRVERREEWMEAAIRAQAFLAGVHHRAACAATPAGGASPAPTPRARCGGTPRPTTG